MDSSAWRPRPITRIILARSFPLGESRTLAPRSPANFPRARSRETAPHRIQSTQPRRPRGTGSSARRNRSITSASSSSSGSLASRISISGGGFLAGAQVEADLVQDAVDEGTGFLTAVQLRELDGLVDGDLLRDVVAVEKLVGGQAEDVPLHQGDPRETPVGGVGADQGVDLGTVFHRPSHQVVSELPDLGEDGMVLPEIFQDPGRPAGPKLQLVEHHQGDFAGFPSLAHAHPTKWSGIGHPTDRGPWSCRLGARGSGGGAGPRPPAPPPPPPPPKQFP